MQKTLPGSYYLEHFWHVVNGLTARYSHILKQQELEYLSQLRGLPEDALKLYVRLTNRQCCYFRIGKLKYAEINITAAVEQLLAAGLIAEPGSDEVQNILACFTLPEIRQMIDNQLAVPRLFCRSEVERAILNWPQNGFWIVEVVRQFPIVKIRENDKWQFCRFLFFGELKMNLSDFVIHDLGTVRTEPVANLQPAFTSRREAEDCFNLAITYEHFRELRKSFSAVELNNWWESLHIIRDDLSPKAHAYFDRLIGRLGQLLEREKQFTAAARLYATSPASPARQRLAKLLLKAGKKNEAASLCTIMLATPNDAEEYYSASQIIAKLNNSAQRSQARTLLNESRQICLDYSNENVEASALNYFKADGWQGDHTENWLWNGIFGLSFWDIIYDDRIGFHQPLQRGPSDLYYGFYYNRRETIEERLQAITDKHFFHSNAEKIIADKYGLNNPFVGWHESLPAQINDVMQKVPLAGVASILREMARDLKNNTRGFPDLFLRKNMEYQFTEVKSENDQLSAQQYFWHSKFKEFGININILKVRPLAA